MASSSVETNELISALENKNAPATTGNLMMQSPSSVDAVDIQKSRKNLSSSSSESTSSPDSPLDDPFREDKDTFHISAPSATSLPEPDHNAQIDQLYSDKPVAETSLSKYDAPTGEIPVSLPSAVDIINGQTSSSDNTLATESPPDQVMERTSNSHYRIPSHVFSRSKSNTPVEWSVASNDSLFSIHMGNMSFTKDQFLWRLDDVGAQGEASPSGHMMFNYSGPLAPASKVADGKSKEVAIGRGTVETIEEVSGLDESQDQIQEKSVAQDHISHHSENGSKAVDGKSNDTENMKKVLSLKETQGQVREKHSANGHISNMSTESSNSTKSFAFPILVGADKNTSISIASSPKLGTEQLQTHSQMVTTSKKQQQPDQQAELNSPAATQPQGGTSWFSCFSCSCCR